MTIQKFALGDTAQLVDDDRIVTIIGLASPECRSKEGEPREGHRYMVEIRRPPLVRWVSETDIRPADLDLSSLWEFEPANTP